MRLQINDIKRFAIFDVHKNMGWLSSKEKSSGGNSFCDSNKIYRLKMQMIFEALRGKKVI